MAGLTNLLNFGPKKPKARPSYFTRSNETETPSGRKQWNSDTFSTSNGEMIESTKQIGMGDGRSLTKTEMGSEAQASGYTVYEDFQFTKAGTSNHTKAYVAANEETGRCTGHYRVQDDSSVSNEAYGEEECWEKYEELGSAWLDAYQNK